MKIIAVIPARFASTRFPGKPLVLLAGKPIIRHVVEAVESTGLFSRILVATDDERIREAVTHFGGEAVMTSSHHQSGSDRIAEVVRDVPADVIFNVQGDEPFISREPLEALANVFRDPQVMVGSLMHRMTAPADIANPNFVKVVTDSRGFALYFSRSVIPYDRDGRQNVSYWKHIGVYAYRKEALLRFVALPQGTLERIESLEQLRLLENGIPLRMVETDYRGIGIDTPEDLVRAEQLLSPSR